MTEILHPDDNAEKSSRYIAGSYLSEGSFGQVYLATDSLTGNPVAVKHVKLLNKNCSTLPKAVFREIEALRHLSECQFIVKLIDLYGSDTSVCLVLEYVESDLAAVIQNFCGNTDKIPRSHVKTYSLMMLKALSFSHQHHIIHRDIKPSRILKLADFGLARIFDSSNAIDEMSHQVSTRQYRAPELLFAARKYTTAVDIWSAAVIMMELFTCRPLFPSYNDIDQMYRVFQLMGSPTPENWPGVESLPDYGKVNFPDMQPVDLHKLFPDCHHEDIDFVERFLVLNPSKRLTSSEGLMLHYFLSSPIPCPNFMLEIPLKKETVKKTRNKPIETVEQLLAIPI